MVLQANDLTLYVANAGEDTAVAVDLKTGIAIRNYKTGAEPHGIDLSSDGRWLFVSSKGDHKLSRIDLRNNSATVIDLQPAPYHVAYAGEVGKLYVSSRKVPKIWVVDPVTLQIITEIDIGQGFAHQMVILPQ